MGQGPGRAGSARSSCQGTRRQDELTRVPGKRQRKRSGVNAPGRFASIWGDLILLRVLNRALNHLEEWLIAALIAAATGLIFIAVVHRYGAGESIVFSRWAAAHGLTWLATLSMAVFTFLSELDLSWAQELCIYMFIWMAKFGAAYGVRTGIHVGVDLLVNRLPA